MHVQIQLSMVIIKLIHKLRFASYSLFPFVSVSFVILYTPVPFCHISAIFPSIICIVMLMWSCSSCISYGWGCKQCPCTDFSHDKQNKHPDFQLKEAPFRMNQLIIMYIFKIKFGISIISLWGKLQMIPVWPSFLFQSFLFLPEILKGESLLYISQNFCN